MQKTKYGIISLSMASRSAWTITLDDRISPECNCNKGSKLRFKETTSRSNNYRTVALFPKDEGGMWDECLWVGRGIWIFSVGLPSISVEDSDVCMMDMIEISLRWYRSKKMS